MLNSGIGGHMKTLDLSAQDLDPDQLRMQVALLREAAEKEGAAPLERLIVSQKTLAALTEAGQAGSFLGFSVGTR
jgi:hypothetical protein